LRRSDEPEWARIPVSGVIAETHNLPSRNANAAVIDDQTRYFVPDLPNLQKVGLRLSDAHRSSADASKAAATIEAQEEITT